MGVIVRMRGIAVFFCLVLAGCSQQDTERLARAGKKAAQKFEAVAGAPDSKWATSWQAVRADIGEMALEARVSVRLRWDKALEDTHIQVSTKEGGIELKGTVSDAEQRRRAFELAESTVGATKVTDGLQVSSEKK